MYCHQNFQIKHSQSRSSDLRLSLKKNIQYGTIIWIESVRPKMKKYTFKIQENHKLCITKREYIWQYHTMDYGSY